MGLRQWGRAERLHPHRQVATVRYTITFNCNGGTINGEEIQTYTGTYGKDAAPWAQGIVQRQGYTFAGWSQDRNGEAAFDPDDRFPRGLDAGHHPSTPSGWPTARK